MLTVIDALQHLGIDYADDMVQANVARALSDAESYLMGAVGADVFQLMGDDPRVDRLTLTYLDDLYDERGTSAKAGSAKRDMIHSMEWQLKLELIRKRGAAEV